jgi:hypothetical protein
MGCYIRGFANQDALLGGGIRVVDNHGHIEVENNSGVEESMFQETKNQMQHSVLGNHFTTGRPSGQGCLVGRGTGR